MSQASTSRKRKISAEPISNPEDVARIRGLIGHQPRDLLLFELALETGVTANQLLALKTKDLDGLSIGDEIIALSGKRDRGEAVVMGPRTYEAFQQWSKYNPCKPDDHLFRSRKGNEALTLPSLSRLVSGWFNKAGLKGMTGLLSLRKTWELQQKKTAETLKETPSPATPEPSYSVNSIRPKTTQELVYKELENAIITARIKPGERLVTDELARQMGTSRIPVREAIGRLEARNFLTVKPQKGATVNELSEKKLREILEIRLMLEGCAVRKATIAGSTSLIENLKRLNEEYLSAQQKNNPDEMISTNREFHFTIYRASNMLILLAMIQNLWDQVSPYYHIMFRQTVIQDPQTGHSHHQHIIDGIREKDPDKVSRWLETDLSDSTDFIIGVVRSMQGGEGA